MNIVEILEKQVALMNDNNYCGNCWELHAPLEESGIDKVVLSNDNECCYHIFVVNWTKTNQKIYDSKGAPFVSREYCAQNFTLYVLKASNMGLNVYNEALGHSLDDSKYKKIIEPLMACFSCDSFIEFCEITGQPAEITNWTSSPVIDYLDNVYDGIRIVAGIRQEI